MNRVVLDKDEEKQQETKLFLPETALDSFFRKIDWAPDGSFFITPLGEYNNASKVKSYPFCAFAFHRNDLKKPAIAYPFEEPVLFASFAPNKFEIGKREKSLFKNDVKMYFALAS